MAFHYQMKSLRFIEWILTSTQVKRLIFMKTLYFQTCVLLLSWVLVSLFPFSLLWRCLSGVCYLCSMLLSDKTMYSGLEHNSVASEWQVNWCGWMREKSIGWDRKIGEKGRGCLLPQKSIRKCCLKLKCLHRLMCFNTWSPEGGTVWEVCVSFRR